MNKSLLSWVLATTISLAAFLIPDLAHAQLYVSTQDNGTVGTYNTNNGHAIHSNFITGLDAPQGLLLSGNSLFVTNFFHNGTVGHVGKYDATTGAGNANLVTAMDGTDSLALLGNDLFVSNVGGTIGEYDATFGTAIQPNFITITGNPQGIVLFGNNLFIADSNMNRVLEYNALSGALITASFITGLNGPTMLAVMGNSLFVSNFGNNTVGKYNAVTGTAINAAFINSGLNAPDGLAVSGNNLYVVNFGSGSVGEYDATFGTAIDASLITGLSGPIGIAVGQTSPVPESASTLAMLALGISGLLTLGRRFRTS